MRQTYETVPNGKPGKSVFDWSHYNLMTADMGYIYPVQCDEVYPGTIVKMGAEVVARMMPLVSPALHPIKVFTYAFFVPYRLLWSDWPEFASGGISGDEAPVLPRWVVAGGERTDNAPESLWDYLGFQPSVVPTDAFPVDFPRRAYYQIYNDYFRDESLIEEVDIEEVDGGGLYVNFDLKKACWRKDYFTSSLLWQQRGTPLALPISGLTSAVYDSDYHAHILIDTSLGQEALDADRAGNSHSVTLTSPNNTQEDNRPIYSNVEWEALNDNIVDLSDATTFNVSDIRNVIQAQLFQERNARNGVRYTELLQAHFGTAPEDGTLQRAQYIGGTVANVIVSEVLQTSESSGTPQGNMAGHGITVHQDYLGSYRAKEHGIVMTVLVIRPEPMYSQGIDRQWLRRQKFDYYWPEFAHLSEQPVERAEIYCDTNGAHNRTVFGFQGKYNELRTKRNVVTGLMRTTFDYWHLARKFDTPPLLNQSFVEIDPSVCKRIFAVQNEPGFVLNYGCKMTAILPIPIASQPGLLDHIYGG